MIHGLILAGGKATRLGGMIKGLIPIENDSGMYYPGKPRPKTILDLQIESLYNGGVDCIWLLARHGIWEYRNWLLKNGSSLPCPIEIIEEKLPLGTGGAISNAMQYIKSNPLYKQDTLFFALNGDIVHQDKDIIVRMLDRGSKQGWSKRNLLAVCYLSSKWAKDYGRIEFDKTLRVESFYEKSNYTNDFYCNAGIYLLNSKLFPMTYQKNWSIEKDYFEKRPKLNKAIIMCENHNWLDVGTPERLEILKGWNK